MEKRERIIVIVMAVAVAYGGYEYLLAPGGKGRTKKNTVVKATGLTPIVTNVVKQIKALDSSTADAYVIARGNSAWPDSPFLRGKIEEKKEDVEPEVAIDVVQSRFRYSGYIEVGERRFAIINGVEHEPGEALAESGFVVTSISPEEVIVQEPGEESMISLKLEDTD
jgi:hypothetical protein